MDRFVDRMAFADVLSAHAEGTRGYIRATAERVVSRAQYAGTDPISRREVRLYATAKDEVQA